MQTWHNLGFSRALNGGDVRQRKEQVSMNNFEKVVASPETLGAFLASLPIADGPWDEQFHRQFCDDCKQTCGHRQYKDKRNNPTWWLKQKGPSEIRALEPGVIVKLENPLWVNIAARHESLLSEMLDGENVGTRLKAAWQTVEEVREVLFT